MASHHITIAKASFAAACLRPDVKKLSRDDLSTFHALFEASVARCSPSNIQKCKQWLLVNIVPSLHRTGALGKYMLSFSKYLNDGISKNSQEDAVQLSQNRQRLHVLYLLNDLLHHSVYHSSNSIHRSNVIEGLQPYVLELLQYVVSEQKSRLRRRIEDFIKIWKQEGYFSKIDLDQVRDSILEKKHFEVATAGSSDRIALVKDFPYIMPATHGDPSTPYYDLPAANLMPHIIPNKAVSIRPDNVRALNLTAGPADEGLINAVKDFLVDVKRIVNPFTSLEDEGIVADLDDLGQLSYRNEDDEVIGDTYYGWSRAFCKRMKSRGRDKHDQGQHRSRSYSSSRSRSRNRSRSPPKRRRYGSSSERSRSRSRLRRTRSHSYSPNPAAPRVDRDQRYRGEQRSTAVQSTPIPLPINNISQVPMHLPLGRNGVPLPPPRPTNWNGPWPPPPPPLTAVGALSNMPFSLPPPPPPPSLF